MDVPIGVWGWVAVVAVPVVVDVIAKRRQARGIDEPTMSDWYDRYRSWFVLVWKALDAHLEHHREARA